MTPKQTAFVAEYLVDLNGTQAAIRAGYSAATECEQAYELLRKPDIAAAVETGIAQRRSRTNLAQDSVLHELSFLALSSIDHYLIDESGEVRLAEGAPEGAMKAIQSIKRRTSVSTDKDGNECRTHEVDIKLWDKPAPLTLLGRHAGLFTNRIEHAGGAGRPLEAIARIECVIVDTQTERANPARNE